MMTYTRKWLALAALFSLMLVLAAPVGAFAAQTDTLAQSAQAAVPVDEDNTTDMPEEGSVSTGETTEGILDAQEAAAAAEAAAASAFTAAQEASAMAKASGGEGGKAQFMAFAGALLTTTALVFLGGGALGLLLVQGALVRPMNVSAQTVNGFGTLAFGGLAFFLLGYPLMAGLGHAPVLQFFQPLPQSIDPTMPAFESAGEIAGTRTNLMVQTIFAIMACAAVCGAVAERVRFWPMALFSVVFAALIYPFQASWAFDGGWLNKAGAFFGNSSTLLLWSAAGWAALAGILIVGARRGKYDAQGQALSLPHANLGFAALGLFMIVLGLPMAGDIYLSAQPVDSGWLPAFAASLMSVTTFEQLGMVVGVGAFAGAVTSQLIYRRMQGVALLLAALGAAVATNSLSLEPFSLSSVGIAFVAGILVVASHALFDRLRLDDPVGILPVFLVAGTWGVLAQSAQKGLSTLGFAALGVLVVGAFVFFTSAVVWLLIKLVMGVRGSEAEELLGFDEGPVLQKLPPPQS